MIRRFLCAALALAMFAAPAGAERITEAAAELVRLHVVAGDNTQEAQELKLKVRDAVLAQAQTLLDGCTDAAGAFRTLTEHLEELEAAAEECARQNGFCGSVRAETGIYEFPDRDYGGVTVPAGSYRALRIAIGRAEGRNWWCVLYPTLCMPEDAQFHSVIAEWFERWFGGDEE